MIMKKIQLTQGKHTVVDEEDYDYLNSFKWYAWKNKKRWYARRNKNVINGVHGAEVMHRVIFGVTDPKTQVDHIDHDGLNNQKSNLRLCSNAQNTLNQLKSYKKGNTSKYKGVHLKVYKCGTKRWVSQIMINGEKVHLGCYASEIEAALAYNNSAKKHHGDFACLNSIKQ